MSDRRDFAASVVKELRGRAGNACSYPGCEQLTQGPKSANGVVNTGTACHIYPASTNGPRGSLSLPVEIERDGYNNGVWMCAYHGRLIDADDGRFPPATLTAYRGRAELRAAKLQAAANWGNESQSLFKIRREIDLEGETRGKGAQLSAEVLESLSETLEDGGIAAEWGGQQKHDIWMLFAEISLNTVKHGEARRVFITVNQNDVALEVPGETFDLCSAPSGAGGGVRSLAPFSELDENATLSLNSIKEDTGIKYVITHREYAAHCDPCSIMTRAPHHEDYLYEIDLADCRVVNVFVSRYHMLSDEYQIVNTIRKALDNAELVIIHIHRFSDGHIREMLDTYFSDNRRDRIIVRIKSKMYSAGGEYS